LGISEEGESPGCKGEKEGLFKRGKRGKASKERRDLGSEGKVPGPHASQGAWGQGEDREKAGRLVGGKGNAKGGCPLNQKKRE